MTQDLRTIGLLEQQLLFGSQQSVDRSFLLGFLHYAGLEVAQDYALAIRYFTQAAESASGWGDYALGLMHETGKGVDKNLKSAIEWYSRAMNKNHVPATCTLALIYKFGPEELRDQDKAIHLLEVAARAGSSYAAVQLADSLERGMGTVANEDAAREWYFRAADLSDESTGAAHAALADIYRAGRLGVPKDPEKAEKWSASSRDYLKRIQLRVRSHSAHD